MLMVWEGAGWGVWASGSPSAASHPHQTSAHPPWGLVMFARCSRAGGAEEGARADRECFGRSLISRIFPLWRYDLCPDPSWEKQVVGELPWEQDETSAFASRMHIIAFWSQCWHLVPTTPTARSPTADPCLPVPESQKPGTNNHHDGQASACLTPTCSPVQVPVPRGKGASLFVWLLLCLEG